MKRVYLLTIRCGVPPEIIRKKNIYFCTLLCISPTRCVMLGAFLDLGKCSIRKDNKAKKHSNVPNETA